MLRLTTLDGVSLAHDGRAVAGVLNRRQSVLLLLLLAASGERGTSRERAAALLWPDGAVRDPRHSLDQLLSVTRAAAGGLPVVASGASTLRLDPDGVRVDVAAFEAALRAGRREEAAALHRAPFADGVSAAGSPALEDLLDATRRRLAHAHATAVRELAEAAEGRGDHADAVRWWQALQLADRLDGAVAARLVGALAAADRGGEALRVAQGAAALLHAELGAADPALARWIDRLTRARAPGAPGAPGGAPPGATAGRPTTAAATRGSAPAGDAPPATIGGRYRVERELRRGRIATTYLASDATGAHGLVEVHVLAGAVAAASPADRFVEVLGRAAALSHPHVLPTLDAGAEGALRWVATARRPDETLEARLAREGPLPIADAAAIARDLAAALAHAHARGVRHGDLRPKHVALAGGGAILCALGLAESVAGSGGEAGDSAVLTLGSAVYQSPEQLLGETRVDARSDVYAFGCVAFEMLAGTPPFGGAGRPGRLQKLTQAAPRLVELRETVPAGLAAVVQRCLARVPADRYASGEGVLGALGADVLQAR